VLLTLKRRRYALPTDAPTLERCLLLLAALILTGLSFALGRTPLFLFIYPVLILLAFRAGPAFVLTAVVLVAMIASGLTAHGLGPLAFLSPNGALLHEDMAQPYLISLLACALPANNALGEKARAAARIQRAYAAADAARQQAVRANAAKSDFIANVSHEIRTPLNGVLGMTQALAREDLTASQRARLDVIQSSGEVLLSLLNDVLDFSKIEAGKLELETAPFDIGRVAQGVAETFEDLAREKGLSFRLTRVEPFAGAVLGDAARVRQILSNLVSNALKFTSTGSVEIRVTALDGIVLEVVDTGIGVPADKISTLFAKFEQVDATTTRRFGGTGLGLSISRELARMMGGQISVESELGAGSRFRVDLPLASDPNAAGADHHAFEADGLGSAPLVDAGAPLRILAAEDNKTNQLVLTTLLADLEVDLTLVDDGLQAIQTWRDGAFDLILMDMQMPVMDGMTAIREIRSAERAAGRVRVPIIAFTADVMSHHLGAYRAAGVDGVVAKPVRFEALVAAIEAALNAPDEVKSAAG
jgi:signal transduction histidine kinase